MSFEFKCAQFKVNDACANATLDFTQPADAISNFVGEGITAATFMLTLIFKSLAVNMSENEARGLNAFRCASTALLQNVERNYLLNL